MVAKAEQLRIKAQLVEAIKVLCKNGLGFKAKLSIEGLLGITLDDDDIVLVSVRELIQKNEDGVLESTMPIEDQNNSNERLVVQGALLQQQQQQQLQQIQQQQQQFQQQQRTVTSQPLERVMVPTIPGSALVMAGSTGVTLQQQVQHLQQHQVSPMPYRTLSVDHITSPVSISHRRTSSLPHSHGSDQISFTSTLDSAIGSSAGSSAQPSPHIPILSSRRRRRTNSDQSEPLSKRAVPSTESSNDSNSISGGENVVVKNEPLSDSENEGTSKSVDSDYTLQTPMYSMVGDAVPGCSTWDPSIAGTPVHTVATPTSPGGQPTQVNNL